MSSKFGNNNLLIAIKKIASGLPLTKDEDASMSSLTLAINNSVEMNKDITELKRKNIGNVTRKQLERGEVQMGGNLTVSSSLTVSGTVNFMSSAVTIPGYVKGETFSKYIQEAEDKSVSESVQIISPMSLPVISIPLISSNSLYDVSDTSNNFALNLTYSEPLVNGYIKRLTIFNNSENNATGYYLNNIDQFYPFTSNKQNGSGGESIQQEITIYYVNGILKVLSITHIT